MAMQITGEERSTSYSRAIGFVYIFNLIVGSGVLTMPRAFQLAGYVSGSIVIYVLALMGYMTATFLVETMSIANGLSKLASQNLRGSSGRVINLYDSSNSYSFSPSSSIGSNRGPVVMFGDNTPLLPVNYVSQSGDHLSPFEITHTFEFSEMVAMFLPWPFLLVFYASFSAYLYGELAVNAAAVPKSIRDLVCFQMHHHNSTNSTFESDLLKESSPCWSDSPNFTRQHAYWVILAGFAVCLVPFTFFNISRTKYLQVCSTMLRWLALLLILALSCIGLATPSPSDMEPPNHPTFNLTQLPALFGVCVYAFMWHHALPNVVAPIDNKSGIHLLLLGDVGIILCVYLLISVSAVFTFPHVQDLYTLNFSPVSPDVKHDRMPDVRPLGYFLVLYPVFTLSTNFPIIAITLRENLKILVKQIMCLYTHRPLQAVSEGGVVLPRWVELLVFPFLAVVPSLGVAFWTNNLTKLAAFTGAYAGTTLQYILPACLAWSARNCLRAHFHEHTLPSLKVRSSPFAHSAYIVGVLVWAVVSIILVSVHLYLTAQ